MKIFKKTTLAIVVGTVTLTAALSANAEIMLGDKNGWSFSTDGQVNQFYTYTENKNGKNTSELRNGLLPGFLGFNVKGPEIAGLKLGARVSISPSTNGHSYSGSFEQREAYFTVDGSFGQVLAGKALGLYGSHNILTDQTLYGVGWGTGENGTTTLGGIGLGYDYADWRSQIRWTSPDMSGFKLAFALVDPQGPAIHTKAGPTGPIGTSADNKSPRYEADLSYAGAFDDGSYLVWLSGMQQSQDSLADNARAWTLGSTFKYSGMELMAQYSDSKSAYAAKAASATLDQTTGAPILTAAEPSKKAKWKQYIVQGGYRFAGKTLVAVSYAQLKDDSPTITMNDKSDRITAGVYHDLTKNLKLVAEFTHVENDNSAVLDQDIYSVGGFVSW